MAALVAATNAPRLIAIASGSDPSVAARRSYLAAGWVGLRARPALGWGPGSVGWTVGEHLQPAPGRNPPGEVVSYLHFLPLDLAYQLGIAGALLAVGGGRRVPDRATPRSRGVRRRAAVRRLDGGAGAGTRGALSRRVSTAARRDDGGRGGGRRHAGVHHHAPPRGLRSRASRGACSHPALQRGGAGRARAGATGAASLRRSANGRRSRSSCWSAPPTHDRSFPLYAARRAWASAPLPSPAPDAATSGADESRIAGEALRAAERAPGVAALWLAAGLLGADAGAPWGEAALRRACDLDPLGALAPFRLMTLARGEHAAAVAGARALLAEPRLAAALEWEGREALYQQAIDEIAAGRESLRTGASRP